MNRRKFITSMITCAPALMLVQEVGLPASLLASITAKSPIRVISTTSHASGGVIQENGKFIFMPIFDIGTHKSICRDLTDRRIILSRRSQISADRTVYVLETIWADKISYERFNQLPHIQEYLRNAASLGVVIRESVTKV